MIPQRNISLISNTLVTARGRRIPEEDDHQIRRWLALSRHIAQLKKNCRAGDMNCRRRQRQALLHWAYDSREM